MELSPTTTEELKEGKKIVHEKCLPALVLNSANGRKYNNLKRSMKENIVTGTSTYPKSPEALLYILNSLSAKSVLAGEKLVATYSISTQE